MPEGIPCIGSQDGEEPLSNWHERGWIKLLHLGKRRTDVAKYSCLSTVQDDKTLTCSHDGTGHLPLGYTSMYL